MVLTMMLTLLNKHLRLRSMAFKEGMRRVNSTQPIMKVDVDTQMVIWEMLQVHLAVRETNSGYREFRWRN